MHACSWLIVAVAAGRPGGPGARDHGQCQVGSTRLLLRVVVHAPDSGF